LAEDAKATDEDMLEADLAIPSENDGGNFDDEEVEEGHEEPSEPPKRYNVSSYGWDSDVEGLVKRLKRGDIYIPGFQRGFVWNGPEKSRFIESLVLGLPVPNVFLAQDAKTKSLNIVDGQQRLRSLGDFMDGKFYLTGKEIQEDLRGCYFSKDVAKSPTSKVLNDSDARALADAVLHSIVIKPDPTHDDPELGHEYNQAIVQIFRRLNTSGKPLQAHEIRTSIFYGPLDSMIRDLNEFGQWRQLFGKQHSRLKDMELILRFIALRENSDGYRSPMPRFLDLFMEEHREMAADKIQEITSAFQNVTTWVANTIGREGLRSGNTLTVSRFDAVMAGYDAFLIAHPEPEAEMLTSKLQELDADEQYQWSIDEFVNDTDRVKKRMERARAIFGD
jgi:hypothetical protein